MVRTRPVTPSRVSGGKLERRSTPVSSRASLLFMQIFGSQLGDGSVAYPPLESPPTTRGSASDAYESDRRGLVGLLSPSSVRVDRPLDQHMSSSGGCAAIYVGAFRNAKGVDVSTYCCLC